MSQDTKQELDAVKEQLRDKTAEASTYFQENERLRVNTILLYTTGLGRSKNVFVFLTDILVHEVHLCNLYNFC